MNGKIAFMLLLPMLTGCTTSQDSLPLIFARTQTFGVSLSGSVPDQGAQLTLGFGDRNIAIVPTQTGDGSPVRATIGDATDSLSVLGQFETSTKGDTSVAVGLGTFFATGQAASKLSDGFAAKMGYGANEGMAATDTAAAAHATAATPR